MSNVQINSETEDFTAKKISVSYNGEIKELSFLEIEAILEEKTSLRSSKPFSVWSKNRIITQSGTISNFAQNFAYFLNQKLFFNNETVFKMNVELGAVKLFNLN